MEKKIQKALKEIALPSEIKRRITIKLIRSSAPSNVLFNAALTGDHALHMLVVILTELISDQEEINESIPTFLSHLEGHFGELNNFDRGIYWHLKGYLAWRTSRSLYQALSHLNRSQQILSDSEDHLAKLYLARVYDTLGQISYNMGHLEDAIYDFETSIDLRSTGVDSYGQALTSGNLGRVHMDLGNWEQAMKFFEADLKIMVDEFPEMTRIQSQLLSHLGHCYFEYQDFVYAEELYRRSYDQAMQDQNYLGQIFALAGLGKIAVSKQEVANACNWRDQARELIRKHFSEPAPNFMGLIEHLSGLISSLKGDFGEAKVAFQRAQSLYESSSYISPTEMAQLLLDFAQVTTALTDGVATAVLLDEALVQLDATTATAKRTEVEALLKEQFRDQWILHTTRRLTGKRSVEKLLEKTGVEGFSVEKNKVVVMFADIRGFTQISEGMDPEDLIKLLNAYLSSMIRTVNLLDGYVVQVQGDAILAVFSLPISHQDDVQRSILAALTMIEENHRLNVRYLNRYPAMHIGVGIHYGEVVTGLIGSPLKRSYTMIGDVVNTTSRIEGLTKILGIPVLATGEIKSAQDANDRYLFMPMGKYVLYGRKEPISIFALMSEKGPDPHAQKVEDWITRSQRALQLFEQRAFAKAVLQFEKLFNVTGIIGFQFLAAQAGHFQHYPPGDEWSGQIELHAK